MAREIAKKDRNEAPGFHLITTRLLKGLSEGLSGKCIIFLTENVPPALGKDPKRSVSLVSQLRKSHLIALLA